MKRLNILILIVCLMSAVVDINAEETNNVSLNDDIIVSAETGGIVWINDSTLFEAPIIKTRSADNVSIAKISSSQRLTYNFVGGDTKYYTNNEPSTVMISLDEYGKIVGWEILKEAFPRSIIVSYLEHFKADFYYTPAKINGKPVKSVGIQVFKMGPQENWRAGGPIQTFYHSVSLVWSPLIE